MPYGPLPLVAGLKVSGATGGVFTFKAHVEPRRDRDDENKKTVSGQFPWPPEASLGNELRLKVVICAIDH